MQQAVPPDNAALEQLIKTGYTGRHEFGRGVRQRPPPQNGHEPRLPARGAWQCGTVGLTRLALYSQAAVGARLPGRVERMLAAGAFLLEHALAERTHREVQADDLAAMDAQLLVFLIR